MLQIISKKVSKKIVKQLKLSLKVLISIPTFAQQKTTTLSESISE
jgi:hypothetical protein